MPVLLIPRPASNTMNFSVYTIAQATKMHYSNTQLLFFFLKSQIENVVGEKMDLSYQFLIISKALILVKSKSLQFKKHISFHIF